jgi:hypothetical protein
VQVGLLGGLCEELETVLLVYMLLPRKPASELRMQRPIHSARFIVLVLRLVLRGRSGYASS